MPGVAHLPGGTPGTVDNSPLWTSNPWEVAKELWKWGTPVGNTLLLYEFWQLHRRTRALESQINAMRQRRGWAPLPQTNVGGELAKAGFTGYLHGSVIITDKLTGGYIPSLHRESQKLIAENGGLYKWSGVAGVVAREALLLAGTAGFGNGVVWLGRGIGFSANALSKLGTAARLAQPLFAGMQAYQVGTGGYNAYRAFRSGTWHEGVEEAVKAGFNGVGLGSALRQSARLLGVRPELTRPLQELGDWLRTLPKQPRSGTLRLPWPSRVPTQTKPPEWATLEPNLTRKSKESVGNLERSMRNNGIEQPSPEHVGHHVVPGSLCAKIPMLREIGFRLDHFPNGAWVEKVLHPGRHPAYTEAMKRILSEIPMPSNAAERAAAAHQVGKVLDAAKAVLSRKNPPLRLGDTNLTMAEHIAAWEAALRAAMKM